MRKILFFLVVLSAWSPNAFTQEKAVAGIRKIMDNQEQAWNQGDIKTFMEGYWKSDSLLFVGKDGPIYGWNAALDRYLNTYPDKASMGTLRFNLLQFDSLSSTAYFVLGKWNLTRAKGNIGGTFTLLFKKINGKWLIVADHTS